MAERKKALPRFAKKEAKEDDFFSILERRTEALENKEPIFFIRALVDHIRLNVRKDIDPYFKKSPVAWCLQELQKRANEIDAFGDSIQPYAEDELEFYAFEDMRDLALRLRVLANRKDYRAAEEVAKILEGLEKEYKAGNHISPR